MPTALSKSDLNAIHLTPNAVICCNAVHELCSIFHLGDMEEQYILVVSWCCQLDSPGFHFFFSKKRVKFGWLSLFWRSDKWKIEFVHFFWEVKVKLKLLEIENKKWKWKQNFREISRNKNLAGDCGASYISDGIFLLSCMKKSFPDYSWSKAALLHWKSLITCIHQRGKDGKKLTQGHV